jgi:hypothetical protein
MKLADLKRITSLQKRLSEVIDFLNGVVNGNVISLRIHVGDGLPHEIDTIEIDDHVKTHLKSILIREREAIESELEALGVEL